MSTTKTAQFTPGPWYPHLAKADHCLSSSVWGAEPGNQIAVIGGKSLQAMNANATLIAAAPVMYDRHKDNHGMVQEALRFLYEGEYEEVKCLLNHIALNSKKAVKQAEGRHHE